MDIPLLSQSPTDLTPFEDTYRFAAFTVVRFAAFTAHALLFGLAAVTILVLRPVFGPLQGGDWIDARRRVGRRLEGFVRASLLASLSVTLIALLLQAVLISEAQGGDFRFDSLTGTLETGYGLWHALRLPMLGALAVMLVGRIRSSALAGAGDAPGRLWWGTWMVLGAGLLLTSSLSGHASVATPRVLSIVNDLVHLLAGSVWFAGIAVLAVLLPDAWARKGAQERLHVLAPAVVRFSTVAAVSIAIIAATGFANSLLHVGALNDLVDSGYGRTLALKVVLFLGVLGLGALNHFVIRRRLVTELESGGSVAPAMTFRKTIAAELILGVLVMGATGVLVGLARTREVAPVPAGTAVTSKVGL